MSGKDGNLITELESKASTPLEGVVFKDSALKDKGETSRNENPFTKRI